MSKVLPDVATSLVWRPGLIISAPMRARPQPQVLVLSSSLLSSWMMPGTMAGCHTERKHPSGGNSRWRSTIQVSLASSPSFTRCIVNFQNPNAIFMFWLRYKFGALEVTKRVGEDWGWVVQLEVGIGNQDHPGWRSLWWWSEGGGNFTIAICNSSGGLPKAGDHHHLIGKEQSRLKGEHGTSTIHCQKLMGNHLASHMSRGLWHFPGLIFFFCLKPPAPYKLHFQ